MPDTRTQPADNRTDSPSRAPRGPSTFVGIAIVFFGFIAALLLAQQAGDAAVAVRGIGEDGRQWVHAFVTSAIVVPLVLLLWIRVNGRPAVEMGLPGPWSAVRHFALGLALLAGGFVLVVVTLLARGEVTFNPSGVGAFAAAAAIAFLFEALPEELAFRGYVYSALSSRSRRWVASLATIALFVLAPVVLVGVQNMLNAEVRIGGSAYITGGYLITLLIFGTFLQFLRVLTGTIWAGVGFHLAFRLFDQIVRPDGGALFRASPTMEDGLPQMLLLGWLLLGFIGLVAYPLVTRRHIGWGEPAGRQDR